MARLTIRRKNRPNEEIRVPDGSSLLETLHMHSLLILAPCGGKGTCGKCRVIVSAAPITADDQKWLSAKELACGIRLACRVVCQGELTVELLDEVCSAVKQAGEGASPEDGRTYGLAVDIGTTTVACFLVDLQSGKVYRSISQPNRQSAYGTDVISRIQYCMIHQNGVQTLRLHIVRQIQEMALLLTDGKLNALTCVLVAGNPVMLHLFLNISPVSMGIAPYQPQVLESRERRSDSLDIFPSSPIPVVTLPSISAFVGADISAAAYAAGMEQMEQPAVLLDIGTNAEMLAGGGGIFFCCSASAGPALEGGNITCGMSAQVGAVDSVHFVNGKFAIHTVGGESARGICGSGLINLIALLLDLHVILPNGAFSNDAVWEEYFYAKDGCFGFWLTDQILLTQEDIQSVQLAKAAIAAGLDILLDRMNLQAGRIAHFYLTGAFGAHIPLKSAIRIGLLPQSFSGRIICMEDGAGKGACDAICRLPEALESMNRLIRHTTTFDLSKQDDFQQSFLRHMDLKETN